MNAFSRMAIWQSSMLMSTICPPPPRSRRDSHPPAPPLPPEVERGPQPVRAGLAEAGGRRVDDARVAPTQRLVAQAEVVHGGRREVLHHHVDALDQPQEQLLPFRLGEGDRDALLAAGDAEEAA